MRFSIFTFLCLLTLCPTHAAEDKESKEKPSSRKQLKKLATEQIFQLRDGALLVCLKTKVHVLDSLEARGQDSLALDHRVEQRIENMEIVDAFKSAFDFCPVYFFFSSDTRHVRSGDWSKVTFLNEELEPDSTAVMKAEHFLVAQFGATVQDSAKYFSEYYYVPGEHGMERRTRYYGGTTMQLPSLVIKSPEFVQLSKPFPYYARTFESLPISRTRKKTVGKLNYKLHRFHKRKTRQEQRKARRRAKKLNR